MNLSSSPIRKFATDLNVLPLDNSPAFFTGCVDCIKIVSQISSLCSNYDSLPKLSSSNLNGHQLSELFITKEQNTDQNHDENNLYEHLPKFNTSFTTPVQYKNQSARTKSFNLRSDQPKVKRVLLPSPPSSKLSQLEYCNKNPVKGTPEVTYNPYENFNIHNNECEEKPIVTTLHNYTGNKMNPEVQDYYSPSPKKMFRRSESFCSDLSEIQNHEEKQIVTPLHSHTVSKRKSEAQDYSPLPKKIFRPSECHCSEIRNHELSQMIWKLFSDHKQTEIVYKKKMALREQLHKILLRKFHKCGLYVVGSSMTGLGANSSDMDMCLMLTHYEIDQEREAAMILQDVQSLFKQYEFLLNVEVIYAKVPILRFQDCVSEIEVDLNINNSVGIRNTQLLNSYARVDKRFPPLVLLTKLWARAHGINDAKNNTLSSYSLVLMVVHYLQYGCKPSVLPCLQSLQPHKFNPHSDVSILKLHEELPDFESRNEEDLGTLFLGFLKYFSHFRFEDTVISVRLGGITPKEIAMLSPSPKNKKGHWKFVCIEEPFDLTNTARAVFKPPAFHYMKQVFLKSWHRLRETANINSILNG